MKTVMMPRELTAEKDKPPPNMRIVDSCGICEHSVSRKGVVEFCSKYKTYRISEHNVCDDYL